MCNLEERIDLCKETCCSQIRKLVEYNERALNNKNQLIRLEAYKQLGFTEKAFDDEDPDIRLEAYRELGFTEKAFNDEDEYIRLEAYKKPILENTLKKTDYEKLINS